MHHFLSVILALIYGVSEKAHDLLFSYFQRAGFIACFDSIRTAGELTPQNAPVLGARVVYDIPRTADLEDIFILYSGNIQLTTGATSLITDGFLNLITSVELLANSGRDVIATLPFSQLVQTNMFRRKRGMPPVITQPGVSIATHPYSVAAHLDLSAFACVRPKDTSLRENNYESLQLAFRFAGDYTGVFTGGGFVIGGATTHNLAVLVRETIELPDANGAYSSPIARPIITSNDVIIAGSGNKNQFKLTPGQGLRGIGLKVQSNASPPLFAEASLTRVRVTVGKVQRLDVAGTTLRAKNNASLPVAAPVGYLFLDFADRNGADDQLSDVLDLDPSKTNGADSILEFDVSAACTITVTQYGYVPLAAR